jgi:ankyrin repeat protein
MLAASKGHCQLVRQLVAAGSSLGQIDIANRSALVHAAIAGKLNVVKYLVACDWNTRPGSTDVTLQDSAQQSLIAAARQGNTAVVEDLLDMIEVQVDKLDPITGETALCSAVMNGHTETVTILLSRGANSNISNKKEMSPCKSIYCHVFEFDLMFCFFFFTVQVATKEGHWAIVERLLQNQADMEQTDSNGKTALMVAAEEGHVGIIELLLNRGKVIRIILHNNM